MRNKKILSVYGTEEYENERYHFEDNPWDLWDSMPHYDPKDMECKRAYLTLEVEFESDNDIKDFLSLARMNISDKTKSTWFPVKETNDYSKKRFVCDFKIAGNYKPENFPKYPIYIPSKSRFEKRMTSDALIALGLKHFMIVEEHQLQDYKSHTDSNWVTLLVLPKRYLEEYDVCDNLGSSKSKGPGAARNFAWDHSISLGAKRHWVMDDNQAPFYRHDWDKRVPTQSGSIFRAMEDHCDRFENVAIAGPTYRFMALPHDNLPPFVQNTRIYSTLLIKNDITFRWRGRYNEDTDLSLRVLKSGLCTIQYNAFTTGKIGTQAMKGGNTEEFYSVEGTLPKSKMIEDLHPDVCQIKWMNGRWHHYCNYLPYRGNRLILKENYYVNKDPEYGMEYVDVSEEDGYNED